MIPAISGVVLLVESLGGAVLAFVSSATITPPRKINSWWRANRDAKGLFKEELAAAKKALRRDARRLPVYGHEQGQIIRRLLLTKTKYHLYYRSLG